MRVFFAAAVIASLVVGPAYAQVRGPEPAPPPKSRQEIEAEKAAERAYKNSLKNIPDKPAADPWGVTREVDTPKAAAKAPAKRTPASSTPN